MVPSPRQTVIVGLIALVPVIVYALGNADAFAAVAAGNVLLIAACLWTMFADHEPRATKG
jgi:hypothetical protein